MTLFNECFPYFPFGAVGGIVLMVIVVLGILYILYTIILIIPMSIKKTGATKESYSVPCSSDESLENASRFSPLTDRYIGTTGVGDAGSNPLGPSKELVYNQATGYVPFEEVGEYRGSFNQQQFLPHAPKPTVYEKINDFPELKHCNEEYWYTLGYLAPSSGDPFIETIQQNPMYYWYGPNLGETPIAKFPTPYVGGCRPGPSAYYGSP